MGSYPGIEIVSDPSIPDGFMAARKPGEIFPSTIVRMSDGKVFKTVVSNVRSENGEIRVKVSVKEVT